MTNEENPTDIGETTLLDENPESRSIFSFTNTELEEVISTGILPNGTTLVGIEAQEDYDKLWRYRSNAVKLASSILKKRIGRRYTKEPTEVKTERFRLKELELELKFKKQESAMFYQKVILDRIDKLELELKAIHRELTQLSKTLVRTD